MIQLTPREQQILHLMSGGKTSREIGALLGISPFTVGTYRRRLHRNYRTTDVAGLMRAAYTNTKEVPVRRPLPPREQQVLELLCEGQTCREIAARLRIGRPTVYTHRDRILEKYQVRNVVELIRVVYKEGVTCKSSR